jgi:hypothetical protein
MADEPMVLTHGATEIEVCVPMWYLDAEVIKFAQDEMHTTGWTIQSERTSCPDREPDEFVHIRLRKGG